MIKNSFIFIIANKIGMSRVIHFEINADKPERAAEFYKKVFNWEIKKWDGPMDYWMVMTGDKKKPGIDGGLMKRMDRHAKTVNTVDVENLDSAIETVKNAGGKMIGEKLNIPTVGWMCYCKDTEGNIFGMIQPSPEAIKKMKEMNKPAKKKASKKRK